jgi:hypothetical protein
MLALVSCAAAGRGQDRTPYPSPPDKKGLQVQMVDDALALGVHHAALNVDLGAVLDLAGATDSIAYQHGGRTWHFRRGAVAALDGQIEPLSRRGVVVSLILLAIATGDPQRDRLLLHPAFDPAAPNHMGAWNCGTAEGRACYAAMIQFLAERWAGSHGRVWNWIVGNEVNSHWWWFNRGHAAMADVVDCYEQAVRVVHEAVGRACENARVFVSLEHHWNIRCAAGNADQAFPGREFLDAFALLVRERGDFDWHVAFHPYPENLFDCRFWRDRSAPDRDDAERVTFHNLPVLLRRLRQPAFSWQGQPRHVILSEQGFHCADGPDGERDQAAAFAAAWWIVDHLDGIDAFILHRHVDHAHEGGLRLGLWSRRDDSICTPAQKRPMYAVFRAAGTAAFEREAAFALPVVGIARWQDLLPAPR